MADKFEKMCGICFGFFRYVDRQQRCDHCRLYNQIARVLQSKKC